MWLHYVTLKDHDFRAFLSKRSVLSTCRALTFTLSLLSFPSAKKAFSTLNIRTSLARCPNSGHRSPSLYSVMRQRLVARRCMKDREVNPAIKRASSRPWAEFNAGPPFPFRSISDLLIANESFKSRWHNFFLFSPVIFFSLPFLCPVIPFSKTITLAGIQRDESPSAAILVSLAICPPTFAATHILSCAAP